VPLEVLRLSHEFTPPFRFPIAGNAAGRNTFQDGGQP
jgi:hypothetical protein